MPEAYMRSLLKQVLVLSIIFLAFISLHAQSGKIAGRVTDGSTGEPLPFVNVIVEGTTQGAATDIDGYYSIIGLRPGTFDVKASAIGYNSQTIQGIRVSIDLTTQANFQLTETSVELKGEIVVVATKPLITKDRTSSTAIVDANDISVLPVTEFQEVLQLQAGVVGGSVRGGRSGEVVYAIDGVPVTDVYDGSSVVNVSTSSIQELQFVSGAFNAEYGKALSGYVNIATKDGSNEFKGSLTTYVGTHYTTHDNIFMGLNKPDFWDIRDLEGSLSGPVINDKIFFYINTRYIYFGGWEYGQRVFNPWDITINRGPTFPVAERYLIDSTGDGKIVPMNWNEKLYFQGKLTWKPFSGGKVDFNYISDNVDYQDYNHFFKLNPDANFHNFSKGITNILAFTHTLSQNAFYTLNLSYFFKSFQQYVYKDPNDTLYTNTALLSQQPTEVPTFSTGGNPNTMFYRTTGTYGIKWDFMWQLDRINQVKAGIDFNRHDLGYNNLTLLQPDTLQDPQVTGYPFAAMRVPDPNNPNENLYIDVYTRKPLEFSAYIQDKIELKELIVNVGLRADYFDPDIYHPVDPAHIAMTLEERRAIWYKDATAKWQISPRLGVAFPITDRGVIHFSYGHFFQIPNFNYLYQNPGYKFGQGTGNLGLAGNPDLKPEQTISGEVGLQQALSDDISFDLTGFFRDVRNLTGTTANEITIFGGSSTYSQFVNSDFGFIKGVVLSLTKRLSNNWSATLDYTLSSAKGNASDPAATRNALISGERPEMQLISLDWDQTQTINGTFSYTSSADWGFSFIAQYGSGFPYTPSQSINLSQILTNAALKPSSFNVDMRAYKDFLIGKNRISLFLRVYNIFDIKNQLQVYNDSGTADFTYAEYLANISGNPTKIVNTVDEYYTNPSFYSEPRRIEVGMSFFLQ
jgi:outer membrane receptor protein involved in Fe transport